MAIGDGESMAIGNGESMATGDGSGELVDSDPIVPMVGVN
jgi:hypothetical protein